MKKSDIKVGGIYEAKIFGGVTIVKVNTIEEYEGRSSKAFNGRIKLTEYHCTNMETGRRVVLRSATKFVKEVTLKITIGNLTPEDAEKLYWAGNSGEIPGVKSVDYIQQEASEEENPMKATPVDTVEQVTPSEQNVTASDSTESDTRCIECNAPTFQQLNCPWCGRWQAEPFKP